MNIILYEEEMIFRRTHFNRNSVFSFIETNQCQRFFMRTFSLALTILVTNKIY